MSVPEPFVFVLLALAAFRLWRLLAHDTVLDRPRARVVREGSGFAAFVECPWCLGFWVAVGWWAAWLAWPSGVVWSAVPFALSAAVVIADGLADRLSA